ncbi:hypothetical protein GGR56DRAFT_665042 [Xylariaceae sp. FL0804]|nr:hypothetical protein GGR56DRAFT_665042 [Xylariaceae sp. FL0804]
MNDPELPADVRDHVSAGVVQEVAVIGAGISGVVSAAHLLREGLSVTVFERSEVIGGAWHYNVQVDRDPPFPNTRAPDPPPRRRPEEIHQAEEGEEEKGLSFEEARRIHAPPGPCYAGLRNNVPTTLMRSSLLSWPEGTDDFVDQGDVRRYVEDIARRHGVIEHIHFSTKVENISKLEGSNRWTVSTSRLLKTESGPSFQRETRMFDAVVVASGHYHIPFVPDIPGLSTWKKLFPGRVTHSKTYRTPDPFKGRTVLLIGAGASALDIAKEVLQLGGKVYQSRRESKYDLTMNRLPKEVERVAMAAKFVAYDTTGQEDWLDSDGPAGTTAIPGEVLLEDGRILRDVDNVVVATGYITSYPFLSELEQPTTPREAADETVITTADGYVTHNLHKDVFYIRDPSLAFVGVSHLVSTFSLFDFQASVLARVFAGRVRLPPRSAMRAEHAARKAARLLVPGDKFHTLPDGEPAYIRELLAWANADLAAAGLPLMEGMDANDGNRYEPENESR